MSDQPGQPDPTARPQRSRSPQGSAEQAAGRDLFRSLAAGVCAVQALALAGFAVFYVWELARGASDDAALVVMSALLIAVFAVGLGALARGWARGASWPNTPTIVWNLLLLPVAWSLFGAGRGLAAVGLAVVAVLGIVAAALADTSEGENPEKTPNP